ncbi:hypothetical protein, partial [Hallella bergensis]|uniref:hypothetical protein n=1 Tax=Hallella bergensis TaxID=242750 RepID=UPI0023F25414
MNSKFFFVENTSFCTSILNLQSINLQIFILSLISAFRQVFFSVGLFSSSVSSLSTITRADV